MPVVPIPLVVMAKISLDIVKCPLGGGEGKTAFIEIYWNKVEYFVVLYSIWPLLKHPGQDE